MTSEATKQYVKALATEVLKKVRQDREDKASNLPSFVERYRAEVSGPRMASITTQQRTGHKKAPVLVEPPEELVTLEELIHRYPDAGTILVKLNPISEDQLTKQIEFDPEGHPKTHVFRDTSTDKTTGEELAIPDD